LYTTVAILGRRPEAAGPAHTVVAEPDVTVDVQLNAQRLFDDGARDRDERRQELGRDLVSAAYLRGDFVLSSGMRSSFYFDKYLFETKPGILRRVSNLLAEEIPPGIDRIAGTELGAVALAVALSLEMGLPFVIARKAPKGYSTSRAVEGELYPGERVVVVEDVISTGAQAILAANRLKEAGGAVVKVVAVIDREQGGLQAIAAAGYECTALFSLSELGL
jgi:orotate phosphoribosyltransferase